MNTIIERRGYIIILYLRKMSGIKISHDFFHFNFSMIFPHISYIFSYQIKQGRRYSI